jgi:hypothetical protein
MPKLYRLDEPIMVTGRSTTYSVVIDGETFDVSGADYETISRPRPAA